MDYQVSLEDASEVTKNITIEIPQSAIDARVKSSLNRVAKQAHLKGFRPGKAPKEVVEKLYGQQLRSDAMGEIVEEAYKNAVENNKLKVVGQPDFKVEGEITESLKIVGTISLFPEPKITKYTGLSFEVEVKDFHDGLIDRALNRMREQMSKLEEVTARTTVLENDVVLVDSEAKIDGNHVPSSPQNGVYLDLSDNEANVENEIKDAIRKSSVGDELNLSIKTADDVDEAYRGKNIDYKIKVKGIYTKNLPEITDEYVKENKMADSLDALKERLKADIMRTVENTNKDIRENKLFETVLENNPFSVPQVMIDEQIRGYLINAGVLDRKDKRTSTMSMEKFRQALGAQSEFQVKKTIALNAILEIEKPEVSEDDAKKWAREMGFFGNLPEGEEPQIPERELSGIKRMLTRERMINKLLEGAKIKEKHVPAE